MAFQVNTVFYRKLNTILFGVFLSNVTHRNTARGSEHGYHTDGIYLLCVSIIFFCNVLFNEYLKISDKEIHET